MDPRRLWKRAAALLAAVGVSIFLAGGISADEGNAEAEPAAALQPTEVVAEIPTEYDTLFELQWGGGSLYHLKGRLATMGCLANNIWIYDNAKWYLYSQYTLSQDTFFVQQFKQQYEQFIPAGVLNADCYNVCDVSGQGCLTFEQLWEQTPTELKEDNFWIITGLQSAISANLPCNDNFHPQIKEQVLPHLPIHPHTCIIKQIPFRDWGLGGSPIAYPRLNIPPSIFLTGSRNYYRSDAEYELFLIKKEVHELCHINQKWHAMQALGLNLHNRYENPYNAGYIFHYFYTSEHGKEFIDVVGFVARNKDTGKRGFWTWYLSGDNIYRDLYSSNPIELSAELCAMYFLDKMGLESNYRYEEYHYAYHVLLATNIRDFNISPYLTPEIVEWLETYMILPQITEDAGDE